MPPSSSSHSTSPFHVVQSALLVLSLLTIASVGASAQIDRAVLEGTVTDSTGAVIPGASVQVLAVDTGIRQEQQTNSNGYYRFPGLAAARYTVTATNPKFRTKAISEVVLQVGQTRNLNIELEVGGLAERVEVKAVDEPGDRSYAEVSTVIRTDQIASLPNNGRDWASFTLLAPFAQDDGGGDQRTIRFAGRARDDNNFQVDGVDAGGIQEQAQKSQTRLQISQDAIEEYRVNSALYDAEYGTQAGGQVDVVTKSGTNDFHGTAFGYLRNSAFDARNFNDFDLNGNPVIPPFRMGQYGTTVGGPIARNKTFFFLSYEGLRQLQATTTQVIVPSASLQQATLANAPTAALMCPILQAFPWRASTGTIGNCAPRFVYPDAAFAPSASDSDTFTAAVPATVHEDTWLVRIDHRFSDKTLLYGRAQRDISLVTAPNGTGTNGGVPADTLQTINHPANYLLALQHTFSPTLFNEAKVYVNRSPFHNPQASALPFAVKTNTFVMLNNNTADIEVGTTFGVIDNLTWSHGRHSFKAGLEIRRVRLNQGKTADNTLDFSDSTGTDDAFKAGQLSGITFNAPWCCHGLRRTFYMPYFQDEWKVTPTLTLTAGLRWEYYGVEHEATNRTTVFDLDKFHGVCLGSGSFNVLPVPPSQGPTNTPPCPQDAALYQPNYKNFDPRVSFAWAPSALHGKTVVRAGFGIYHGAAQNDDLNAGLESDTFRVKVNQATTITSALEQEIPDFSGIATGLQKAAAHPRALQRQDRRDLYAEEWGLTIEHELPAGFLFSTQYLGSRGVHLFSRGGVDLCSMPVTFNSLNGDCVRPLDQYYVNAPTGNPFGSVDIKRDIGSSTYNGLEVSVERRFTSGLSFQSHYTFSHSINDGSVGGGESNGPENVNCLPCDKGPSIFDIRHNFTANAVYELPFGPGKTYLKDSGALGKIVGGWRLSGIGLWHTGHPLTVLMDLSGSINNTNSPFNGFAQTYLLPDGNDQTSQRPDIAPGVQLTLPGGGRNGLPLINAAAFQAPPVDANGNFTRFGNAGNGIIRALAVWQVDLALTKETKLTERFSMELAVQAFNIFNHVQFGDPGALTLTYAPGTMVGNAVTNLVDKAGNFGIITTTVNFNNNNDNKASPNTGTGLPRQLQVMLRFLF
jgi:hypothetical protein